MILKIIACDEFGRPMACGQSVGHLTAKRVFWNIYRVDWWGECEPLRSGYRRLFWNIYVEDNRLTIMNKLSQIEQLRKEFVASMVDITGLPVDDISVEVALLNQDMDSELAQEARNLAWYPDQQGESSWYSTEIPQGGATTVFVERLPDGD